MGGRQAGLPAYKDLLRRHGAARIGAAKSARGARARVEDLSDSGGQPVRRVRLLQGSHCRVRLPPSRVACRRRSRPPWRQDLLRAVRGILFRSPRLPSRRRGVRYLPSWRRPVIPSGRRHARPFYRSVNGLLSWRNATNPRSRACSRSFRTRNSTPKPCWEAHRTFAKSTSTCASCPGSAMVIRRYAPLSRAVGLWMEHPLEERSRMVPVSCAITCPAGPSAQKERGHSTGMRGFFRESISPPMLNCRWGLTAVPIL